MAQAPAPEPPDWIASLLNNQSTGATSSLEDILKMSMLGVSGRQGLTDQPLVGVIPQWVRTSPQMLQAVRQGFVDPYLPTTDVSTWRVYMSRSDRRSDIPQQFGAAMEQQGVPRALAGDKSESLNAVANQPFLWSEDEIKGAIKKFHDAGHDEVTDLPSLQKAWEGLATMAAARYSLSSGKIKVTPWDMLELDKNTSTASGASGSPSTVTQTSRSVATITHGDGWSALQNTLSKMLGRDPSDDEVRDFVGRMNFLASKNPTITRSTTSGIGTAHQNTSSHTKSGFDSNDILENAYSDAQSNPDYAEFQSASTYYNAALSALGAIGG